MNKRNKIIFGTMAAVCVVIVWMLFVTPFGWHDEEIAVVPIAEKVFVKGEVSKEPEISEVRKELERFYEERGNVDYLIKVIKHDLPVLGDSPEEYSFNDRVDLYLSKLSEMAEEEGQYDSFYNAISDMLIYNYQDYKKELSEENCERFLAIINLCKERLQTARVWVEPIEEIQEESQEEPEEEPIEIKLTDVRRELERLYEERGTYNSRSEREYNFLWKNYNIPVAETTGSSEDSFEDRHNTYLDEMEALVKPEEWDLLYESISDSLIWDYDLYRGRLTEEQCERILELIKLCKKYAEETTQKY